MKVFGNISITKLIELIDLTFAKKTDSITDTEIATAWHNIEVSDASNDGYVAGNLTVAGNIYADHVNVLPPGAIWAYAGESMPSGGGWLLCDGSAISRTTYENLFNVIGIIYGAGDGETTFNLPDLTDKFIEGSATVGTEKTAGLPNITGGVSFRPIKYENVLGYSGAFSNAKGVGRDNATCESTGMSQDNVSFDASRSSAIYGNSTTVQPPALTLRYIIKY